MEYLNNYLCFTGVATGAVILFHSGTVSSSYYYGIVRIYYEHGWGNICHDMYFTQYEADVICHQLGYTGASSYSRAGLVRYDKNHIG